MVWSTQVVLEDSASAAMRTVHDVNRHATQSVAPGMRANMETARKKLN